MLRLQSLGRREPRGGAGEPAGRASLDERRGSRESCSRLAFAISIRRVRCPSRLRLRGLDVHTAANGFEAIEIASREHFDLALIDLKMPGLDGGQVVAKLEAEHPDLEAIILTGHGTLDSVVELSEAGAFTCLPNPSRSRS